MCLHRKEGMPLEYDGEGNVKAFKIFRKFMDPEDGLRSPLFRSYAPYGRGEWLREEDWRESGIRVDFLMTERTYEKYDTGFHAFLSEQGAKELRDFWGWDEDTHVVLPVLLRSITATGMQLGVKIIVAREMFIPPAVAP